MAKVIPFRGILYNEDKIGDFSKVVTPPYDVISPVEQKQFYDRHPANVIRLDFGQKTADDNEENNSNTRAAGYFDEWITRGILLQDDNPCIYLTSVEFSVGGETITRYGMIALVGLEPFEKKIVLPHEKTFSKVKSERLDLMKACHSNFSQIFSLYSDREGILEMLKKAASGSEPFLNIPDDKKHRHKMWRITDPGIHEKVTRMMEKKRLFIADGHHRYETALNYRKWRSQKDPDFNENRPANYVMMYLCSMEDPGLVVLPAHRMLFDVGADILSEFIEKAGLYFDITTIPVENGLIRDAQRSLVSILESNDSKNAIGVYMKGRNAFFLMILKPGVMEKTFSRSLPESLRQLDVTVLTQLVFMEILGFNGERLDNEKLIAYSSSVDKAVDSVADGNCDICFILNSTKIEQVKNIAEEGQIMPRKTTYFFPKAITGQVIYKLM